MMRWVYRTDPAEQQEQSFEESESVVSKSPISHFYHADINKYNPTDHEVGLRGISERYEVTVDEVGFDRNHIHIFCGAPPRVAPLRIVTIIKSITARRIFERFPKLRKEELWGGEFWSDGKYIGTVGKATSETTIKRYI